MFEQFHSRNSKIKTEQITQSATENKQLGHHYRESVKQKV